jgi:threonine dehydratase
MPGPEPRALYRARARIRPVARRTPLQRSPWLSDRVGVDVHLKLECWQLTGAFKLRGAYNAVAGLDEGVRARGLVTASAGNHGQAVALAARMLGCAATVYVPCSAPETKKARIRQHGAELREVDGTYDDAAREARAAAESGLHFVHPFSDPDVVAGQGTVGLELVEDLPSLAEVVVPVGGGGLLAGVGLAVRATLGPDVRVTGVQSSLTRAMHAAFEAGHVVDTAVVPTLCDGLAGEVEPVSYERARAVADSIRLVDEADVRSAIASLFHHDGVVAEGAGAVGVAALLAGVVRPAGPTAVVVSGGNIDGTELARILGDG